MASLNNQAVTDTYPAAAGTGAILTFDPSTAVTVQVAQNGSVYARFALANPPGLQVGAYRNPTFEGEEKFLVPANYTWRPSDFRELPIVGVMFRNATPGVVARVTVSA